MPLYTDITQELDPRRHSARVAAYRSYLQALADYLPDETKEFVLSDWYYSDIHRCPHDAWLESFEIVENSSGDRQQNREIEIRVNLLSASQAGHIHFQYRGVSGYNLGAKGLHPVKVPSMRTG